MYLLIQSCFGIEISNTRIYTSQSMSYILKSLSPGKLDQTQVKFYIGIYALELVLRVDLYWNC